MIALVEPARTTVSLGDAVGIDAVPLMLAPENVMMNNVSHRNVIHGG